MQNNIILCTQSGKAIWVNILLYSDILVELSPHVELFSPKKILSY